jgi:hypothetical protein
MRIYEFIFLKTCVIFVLLIIVAIFAIFNGMQSRYYYTLYGEMRIVNSIKQLEASSKNLLTQNNKPRKIRDLLNEIVEFLDVAIISYTFENC